MVHTGLWRAESARQHLYGGLPAVRAARQISTSQWQCPMFNSPVHFPAASNQTTASSGSHLSTLEAADNNSF